MVDVTAGEYKHKLAECTGSGRVRLRFRGREGTLFPMRRTVGHTPQAANGGVARFSASKYHVDGRRE